MNLYSVLIFYRQKLAGGILVIDVFCSATVKSAFKSGTIGIGSDVSTSPKTVSYRLACRLMFLCRLLGRICVPGRITGSLNQGKWPTESSRYARCFLAKLYSPL